MGIEHFYLVHLPRDIHSKEKRVSVLIAHLPLKDYNNSGFTIQLGNQVSLMNATFSMILSLVYYS